MECVVGEREAGEELDQVDVGRAYSRQVAGGLENVGSVGNRAICSRFRRATDAKPTSPREACAAPPQFDRE